MKETHRADRTAVSGSIACTSIAMRARRNKRNARKWRISYQDTPYMVEEDENPAGLVIQTKNQNKTPTCPSPSSPPTLLYKSLHRLSSKSTGSFLLYAVALGTSFLHGLRTGCIRQL